MERKRALNVSTEAQLNKGGHKLRLIKEVSKGNYVIQRSFRPYYNILLISLSKFQYLLS